MKLRSVVVLTSTFWSLGREFKYHCRPIFFSMYTYLIYKCIFVTKEAYILQAFQWETVKKKFKDSPLKYNIYNFAYTEKFVGRQ